MNHKWYKKNYVCSMCDALIEITTKSDILRDKYCYECNGNITFLSVLDVTIVPSTEKDNPIMETTTLREQIIQEMELRYGNEITELKNQIATSTIKLDFVENDEVTTKSYSKSDVRALLYRDKSYQTKMNEYYHKESQLRTLLENVYADSNEQDTLTEIAEIFDVPLTKEIEVTAYIRVDMTIEIDMAKGDYDIEDMVRNQLTVDSFGSEISVNDYDVERVEEGAY